jgi:hypothetical protein
MESRGKVSQGLPLTMLGGSLDGLNSGQGAAFLVECWAELGIDQCCASQDDREWGMQVRQGESQDNSLCCMHCAGCGLAREWPHSHLRVFAKFEPA